MVKISKALFGSAVLFFLVFAVISCEKDFNTLESDVLGEDNVKFLTDSIIYSVSAKTRVLSKLKINNLVSNFLGIYNDPAYDGVTKASVVAQIVPTTFNPDFGVDPKIESITITIPYFSTKTNDVSSNTNYQLDSLYGDASKEIKLSVYQNKYYFFKNFSETLDPLTNEPSITNVTPSFYSKSSGNGEQNTVLSSENNEIKLDDLTGELIYTSEKFKFSNKEVETITYDKEGNEVKKQNGPALQIVIDTTLPEKLLFWKELILNREGDAVLSSADNFKSHFRGLYFKAEEIPANNGGAMALLNFRSSQATVVMNYEYTPENSTNRQKGSYTFSVSDWLNVFNNPNKVIPSNDTELYLKGNEGAMAVVELFSKSADKDEFLDAFRIKNEDGEFAKDNRTGNYLPKRLINEAFLTVTEVENLPFNLGADGENPHKSDRIYAYNIANNTPIIDYQQDPTENLTNALNSKIQSLKRRDKNGRYKIRVTEFLNNIILTEDAETKIGLVLSNNVNYTASAGILKSDDAVTGVPAASILSPRGTILYGTKAIGVSEDKKPQLKVFYSEIK